MIAMANLKDFSGINKRKKEESGYQKSYGKELGTGRGGGQKKKKTKRGHPGPPRPRQLPVF